MIPFELSEYQCRRAELIAQVRAQSSNHRACVLIPAKHEDPHSYSASRYRPDSTFLYFTGLREPASLLLINISADKAESTIFLRPKDKAMEIWDGPRLGIEAAVETLGVQYAQPIGELESALAKILPEHTTLSHAWGIDERLDALLLRLIPGQRAMARQGVSPITHILDLRVMADEMRLKKSAWEIAQMRHACTVSAHALREAIPRIKAGANEQEIMGFLLGQYYQQGLSAPSYNPIVGAHAHACILHYIDNNATIPDNALTLIDAGGEYYGYCADITRTYPSGKTYTHAQREIYDIVWAAHDKAMAEVRVGKSFNDYHLAAVRVITEGLIQLKLIEGDVDTAIAEEKYKPFFMHRTGHYLGMDTHDVGVYRTGDSWRALESGMILTVEPGIYIRPSATIPERYHNIGIRLENDILITETGCDNLTVDAPINPTDIEKIKAKG